MDNKDIRIAVLSICPAFNTTGYVVGSRVHAPQSDFLQSLSEIIPDYDFKVKADGGQADHAGQGKIKLPKSMLKMVASGDGLLEGRSPGDFINCEWRKQVGQYLRSEFAAPVKSCFAIVYTRAALEGDPESKFFVDQLEPEHTHALVAVIASGLDVNAEYEPPVSYKTFVKNLAGANNAFDILGRLSKQMDKHRDDTKEFRDSKNGLTKQIGILKDEVVRLVGMAKETDAHHTKWGTVAYEL